MGEIEVFAKRLKQLRESMGMTQLEFSEFIGVKQQNLSGYENGKSKPPLDVARGIADNCEISLDWLCGLSEQQNLNAKIKTYSDVLRLLYLITLADNFEVLQMEIIDDNEGGVEFFFYDDIITQGIASFNKMYELYKTGSIDKDMYSLLINSLFEKYDIPIKDA